MRVAIDHRLCDGCGLCTTYAPGAFRLLADGLAYPAAHGAVPDAPPPGVLLADVPESLRGTVLEAVEICPEACLEVDPEVEGHDEPMDVEPTGELVAFVRSRYHGSAFDEVARIATGDGDLHVWTAAGSYHRIPASPPYGRQAPGGSS